MIHLLNLLSHLLVNYWLARLLAVKTVFSVLSNVSKKEFAKTQFLSLTISTSFLLPSSFFFFFFPKVELSVELWPLQGKGLSLSLILRGVATSWFVCGAAKCTKESSGFSKFCKPFFCMTVFLTLAMTLPSSFRNGVYCVSKFPTSVHSNVIFIAWERAMLLMYTHLPTFRSQTGHSRYSAAPWARTQIHQREAFIKSRTSLWFLWLKSPSPSKVYPVSTLSVVPNAEFVPTFSVRPWDAVTQSVAAQEADCILSWKNGTVALISVH